MKSDYESVMNRVWEAKEKTYQDFLNSGLPTFAEFVEKEISEMRSEGLLSDKIFERVDKIKEAANIREEVLSNRTKS